jgi:hypothetical protein
MTRITRVEVITDNGRDPMFVGKKTTTLPYHTKMMGGHSKCL